MDADAHLNTVLSALVVECVFDALAMAGVADRGRMTEIAATVLLGGPDLPEEAFPEAGALAV